MVSETQQWVNFGLFIAGGAAVTALIIGDSIKRRWLRLLTAASLSAAFCFAVWWFQPLIEGLLNIVQFPLVLALLAISLGVGAHFFKRKNKLRYGQVEVLVGMLTAVGIAFATGQSVFTQLTSLAGATYVVARGLSNWDEQLEAQGDKRGNRSIWQQMRTLMIKEVKSGEPTTGGAPAVPPVAALPDYYKDQQKQGED